MAILLKTASVRVSSIQIMQVRVQNKGKSVWKSRYDGDVSTRFGINEKYWRKNQHQGAHTLSTRVCRAPPALWPPLGLHRSQPQLHIFMFGEKKIREKDSSRCTIRSRRQALISLGRADLESIRGSGEGDSSPSSSSTILHHQFHDAHRRA